MIMKRRAGRVVLLLALAGAVTGCDDGCDDCHDAPVIVETVCCDAGYTVAPFRLDVAVRDTAGYWLGGATVEVIVAAVPEQRLVATTGNDGTATVYAEAPVGATLVVYACAPGYTCQGVEVVTSALSPGVAVVITLPY